MTQAARNNSRRPEAAVENWNKLYERGQAVAYRKDDNTTVTTRTRTEACILGGHTAVVWLEGVSGCVALDRVTGYRGGLPS